MWSWLDWTFSSEKETGDFVPPYTDLLSSYRHGFHFLALNYVLKYIASNIESLTKLNLNAYINYGRSLNYTLNVYYLELVPEKWDTN